MSDIDSIIQELEAQFAEEDEALEQTHKNRFEYLGAVSFLSVDGDPIDGDNIYVGGAQLRLDEYNTKGDAWDQPFVDGLLADFFDIEVGTWGDFADNCYRIVIEKVEPDRD